MGTLPDTGNTVATSASKERGTATDPMRGQKDRVRGGLPKEMTFARKPDKKRRWLLKGAR